MQSRAAWRPTLAALAVAAAGAACDEPKVGPPAQGSGPVPPLIAVTGASVSGSDQVVATFTVTRSGALSASEVASLRPTWTLAELSTEPVSGIAAWKSLVLTGAQTLAQLPVAGPGTPPQNVLANVKQPGAETAGATVDLGDGSFSYTFATPLPAGWDPTHTYRIGVWLAGTPGAAGTSATFDFVPAVGPPQVRDTVLDQNCDGCHGRLAAHEGYRSGVRLCLTCHTFQNADPDTTDPAAMSPATPATDPNPLELGRLVHRIHRGRNLPTLYASSSTAPAPALPSATALPLPFFPGRNAAVAGARYSVVGDQGREFVFGRVLSRTDNGQPARLVAAGVAFPRDLRHCDACHGGAPQATEQVAAISRRTCQGCHPDAWFGAGGTDQVHFAHAGGPQPDDTQCAGCHIAATPTQPKVYAPIAELHRPPFDSPRWNGLTGAIVAVANLSPGMSPTVTFTLADRDGAPTPLGSPTPAADATSPVPRALERVAITFSGPTAPDYLTSNAVDALGALTSPITEVVPLTAAADGQGRFSHTFAAAVPAGATGTWAVSLEARRRAAVLHYDTASDTFPWPGTGETVTEWTGNPVVYVDTALGTSGGGNPVARRQVVDQARCQVCHQRLSLHGGLRHDLEYCLMCHTADRTDRAQRPKDAGGNVRLSSTFDGIEERSVHFKVMVHRIHTGARRGRAELSGIEPYVIYGFGGNSFFFDEVEFPGDLRDCRLCHAGETFAVQSVPADAPATVGNEAGSILHAGTAVHPDSDPRTPPIQAACLGCHATGPAQLHASKHTTSAGEQCRTCHGGRGTLSAYGAHGLTLPAP